MTPSEIAELRSIIKRLIDIADSSERGKRSFEFVCTDLSEDINSLSIFLSQMENRS